MTLSPAIFQKTMKKILKEYLGICCEVYIDGIIIYSDTKAQPIIDIEKVLKALNDAEMKIKILKNTASECKK